ncbi:hypothetical protein [Hyphomicrobium sp. LHD-15]|uniref:hypothetical protein n=1 Tax=Hyphomicrobium sp. LHD-15 TaxID=3072142 RepID=UPI00280F8919|nr:hypothetical protein [Hyphomicrobium sp. LHD-15]MDQ8699250.1 hypothetical protein [Hyphomicrobium sp. LHD-15]
MNARALRFAMTMACAAVAASAQAQDWGNIAVISSTLGNNAGRLCVGEGLRVTDIGCPSYAPSLTTAGDISVTGNLSANKFIGDGSLLTGVGQSDRITSGTTNVIATQDRSVTISTAGSQRIVVGENGYVGLGTSFPSGLLSLAQAGGGVRPTLDITAYNNTAGQNYYSQLNLMRSKGSSMGALTALADGDAIGLLEFKGPNGPATIFQSAARLRVLQKGAAASYVPGQMYLETFSAGGGANNGQLVLNPDGNVGIATTTPAATLQVSGSFIVSTSAQTTTPSLYVGTNGNVGVGTSAPGSKLEIRGSTAGTVFDNLILANAGAGIGTGANLLFNLGGATTYSQIQSNADVNNGASLRFSTRSGATSTLSEKLRISNDGLIGIGTTTPSATLTVSGSAIISGTVQVAGTGNEACTPGTLGTIRFNPVTGAPQICVQR